VRENRCKRQGGAYEGLGRCARCNIK
jgi:hypothetical protein